MIKLSFPKSLSFPARPPKTYPKRYYFPIFVSLQHNGKIFKEKILIKVSISQISKAHRHHKTQEPVDEGNSSAKSRGKNAEIESSTVVEGKWIAMKTAVLETQREDIGFQTQTKKQPWTTEDVPKVMKERRKHKSKNEQRYRKLNRTIRRKYREARE